VRKMREGVGDSGKKTIPEGRIDCKSNNVYLKGRSKKTEQGLVPRRLVGVPIILLTKRRRTVISLVQSVILFPAHTGSVINETNRSMRTEVMAKSKKGGWVE